MWSSACFGGAVRSADEGNEDEGAEPVCVCVGGFCRCGTKERTRCSVAMGEVPAHCKTY
jgi:hypothetical protein